MSFQLPPDPPSLAETLDAFEELVRLKERFGHYDEPTSALLGLAIDRFAMAFGDDDWQARVGVSPPNNVTQLRAVAG